MREYNIKRDQVITDQLIADIAVTAFEGGISYWCDRAEAVKRNEHGEWERVLGDEYEGWLTESGVSPYANPEFWDNGKRGYRLYDPYEERWCDHVLTMSGLLKAMHYQPPHRKGVSDNWFRKVIDRIASEQYDAADADCLVQIAVFGEGVYG